MCANTTLYMKRIKQEECKVKKIPVQQNEMKSNQMKGRHDKSKVKSGWAGKYGILSTMTYISTEAENIDMSLKPIDHIHRDNKHCFHSLSCQQDY